jgi:hypothetical protein
LRIATCARGVEHLVERAALVDRRRGAAPGHRVPVRDLARDHLLEHRDVDRLRAAVVFGLVLGARSGPGAGELGRLVDVLADAAHAEGALDRLRLAVAGCRPVHVDAEELEHAVGLVVAHLETEAVLDAARHRLVRRGERVVDRDGVRDAVALAEVAERELDLGGRLRLADAPAQHLRAVDVLPEPRLRPEHAAGGVARPQVVLVAVAVHDLERVQRGLVADLRREERLRRLHALALHHHHRPRQLLEAPEQRARRGQRPGLRRRDALQARDAGARGGTLGAQVVGEEQLLGLGRQLGARGAADVRRAELEEPRRLGLALHHREVAAERRLADGVLLGHHVDRGLALHAVRGELGELAHDAEALLRLVLDRVGLAVVTARELLGARVGGLC